MREGDEANRGLRQFHRAFATAGGAQRLAMGAQRRQHKPHAMTFREPLRIMLVRQGRRGVGHRRRRVSAIFWGRRKTG